MWTTSTVGILKPNAIALGNFDGIHRGHKYVLQPILDCQSAGVYKTVVSFKPHPREYFSGKAVKLLTPVEEKAAYLEFLGFDQLVLLPFTQALAVLTPQQFVEEIIIQQLDARKVSVGADFRFGYQRQGTASQLKSIATAMGIEVEINPLQQCIDPTNTTASVRISSSLIRQALTTGDVETANRMLDRPYSLTGTVVKGQQLGRTIGFPTANLAIPQQKFLPRDGVYAVRVFFDLVTTTKGQTGGHMGVMNIGHRPTVAGNNTSVEIHLLDWSGDLYGQRLTVSLQQFIRPEQKFDGLASLEQQITLDCKQAREILS